MEWMNLFSLLWIALMLFLALKRFLLPCKRWCNFHPVGEWGMYAYPITITQFKVIAQGKDRTKEACSFLWHNLAGGKFVTVSHPDLPEKAVHAFHDFLKKQWNTQVSIDLTFTAKNKERRVKLE